MANAPPFDLLAALAAQITAGATGQIAPDETGNIRITLTAPATPAAHHKEQ